MDIDEKSTKFNFGKKWTKMYPCQFDQKSATVKINIYLVNQLLS